MLNYIDKFDSNICNNNIGNYFFKRFEEGKTTRDENPISHFCCYFLPYNPATKEIFIIHHKKSGLWLSPGGHIDKDENTMQTLNREIEEELGIKNKIKEKIKPFLLTIASISNPVQPCKIHFDIWYRFSTDGSEFNVDPKEFHETRWSSIEDERKLITDSTNIEALDKMEKFFKS